MSLQLTGPYSSNDHNDISELLLPAPAFNAALPLPDACHSVKQAAKQVSLLTHVYEVISGSRSAAAAAADAAAAVAAKYAPAT